MVKNPKSEPDIDWRSILVRYMRAVMDDDFTIGERCCNPDCAWSPEWTKQEAKALDAVFEEAQPEWLAKLKPEA